MNITYRGGEQISNCQELNLDGSCGYKWAIRGIIVVMAMCTLTASMPVSGCDVTLKFCKVLPS